MAVQRLSLLVAPAIIIIRVKVGIGLDPVCLNVGCFTSIGVDALSVEIVLVAICVYVACIHVVADGGR